MPQFFSSMPWIYPFVRWLMHSFKKLLGDYDLVYTPYWNGSFFWTTFLYRIRGTVLIFQIRKEICNLFVIYLGSLDLGQNSIWQFESNIKNDVASQVNGKYVQPKNLNVVSRCSGVISMQWPISNSPFKHWKANQAWNIFAFLCSIQYQGKFCPFECLSDTHSLKNKCPQIRM